MQYLCIKVLAMMAKEWKGLVWRTFDEVLSSIAVKELGSNSRNGLDRRSCKHRIDSKTGKNTSFGQYFGEHDDVDWAGRSVNECGILLLSYLSPGYLSGRCGGIDDQLTSRPAACVSVATAFDAEGK
jgi:hypothetical protein